MRCGASYFLLKFGELPYVLVSVLTDNTVTELERKAR